jgi:hypothetical protein
MAQTYLRNPSIERLPNILEQLHTGALCIPPFQRDFEWTGEQRLALCNSVGLGLPTGSLMVWRTSRHLAAENPVGPYRVPTQHPEAGVQYLLDGRQRMTTLYAALAAAFWTRDGDVQPAPEAEHRDAPDGTPWDIYYDLENENFVFPARRPKQLPPPDNRPLWLPLSVLFDDSAYDEWRNQAKPSRDLANRARAIRSAFMDYQIPVVPLAVEDIGIVTLTFKRVNNGGTPMSDADMARALAWSEGFDLRVHINNAREQLAPSGWSSVEDDPLLLVVASVCGLEPIAVDPEKLANEIKAHPEVIERATRHILSAAEVLRKRIGIVGPTSLPYAQVLVFAARAFHEANGDLSPDQQNKLTAWIAEVCLDERFGGAPPHVVRAEWRTFARRLELPKAEPAVSRRDERIPVVNECWKFSLAWARSLGTGLVLAEQKPKLGDGKNVKRPHANIATGSENVARLLAAKGEGLPSQLLQSVVRLRGAALHSPSNRVICPIAELPALREALLQRECATEILRSHLISGEAHTALLNYKLDEFFELRRADIWQAEKRWLAERGGTVEFQDDPRKYKQG